MKPPLLFDKQPRVTHADRKRLGPLLSGWTKLCPALKQLPDEDLKRCVIIEATGHCRVPILERLLGRHHKNTRNKILHEIQQHKTTPTNP